jgi:histone H3/H4
MAKVTDKNENYGKDDFANDYGDAIKEVNRRKAQKSNVTNKYPTRASVKSSNGRKKPSASKIASSKAKQAKIDGVTTTAIATDKANTKVAPTTATTTTKTAPSTTTTDHAVDPLTNPSATTVSSSKATDDNANDDKKPSASKIDSPSTKETKMDGVATSPNTTDNVSAQPSATTNTPAVATAAATTEDSTMDDESYYDYDNESSGSNGLVEDDRKPSAKINSPDTKEAKTDGETVSPKKGAKKTILENGKEVKYEYDGEEWIHYVAVNGLFDKVEHPLNKTATMEQLRERAKDNAVIRQQLEYYDNPRPMTLEEIEKFNSESQEKFMERLKEARIDFNKQQQEKAKEMDRQAELELEQMEAAAKEGKDIGSDLDSEDNDDVVIQILVTHPQGKCLLVMDPETLDEDTVATVHVMICDALKKDPKLAGNFNLQMAGKTLDPTAKLSDIGIKKGVSEGYYMTMTPRNVHGGARAKRPTNPRPAVARGPSTRRKYPSKIQRFRKMKREIYDLVRRDSVADPLCSKEAFKRCIKEATAKQGQEMHGDDGYFKVSKNAYKALQEASERFITDVCADALIVADVCKRKTLKPEHMTAACAIRADEAVGNIARKTHEYYAEAKLQTELNEMVDESGKGKRKRKN